MLRAIEDILGLEPMGLNDGLQRPMTDVFTPVNKPWSYTSLVPDVLRPTQLPLPPPTTANRVAQTQAMLAFLARLTTHVLGRENGQNGPRHRAF